MRWWPESRRLSKNWDKVPGRVPFIAPVLFILVTTLLLTDSQVVQGQPVHDTLTITRNWRTRNAIVLEELLLPENGKVSNYQINRGIDRLWNMGNFAQVDYYIDTLKDGKVRLNFIARDAFTIVPIVSLSGNVNDYRGSLGVNDNNFLGKNIDLYAKYGFGTYDQNGAFSLGIPRQMLPRNMTLKGEFRYGKAERYRYSADSINSGISFNNTQLALHIGNPWHSDEHYTFSPNLSIRVFSHTITSLYPEIKVDPRICVALPVYRFVLLSVGESIGHIYKRKHRQDGYSVGASYSYGIGLNSLSPNYHQFGLGAQYHKRLNRLVQFSSSLSTGYTTADLPSLLYYHGGSTIKGLRTGQISGKTTYSGYLGFHFTYLDTQWFAIENKFFTNIGQGADSLKDLYTIKPFLAVGTGVRFMVPMIPWLYINLYFSYSGKDRDWFFLEF
jgi:outer membrane protein assembly factor BamA